MARPDNVIRVGIEKIQDPVPENNKQEEKRPNILSALTTLYTSSSNFAIFVKGASVIAIIFLVLIYGPELIVNKCFPFYNNKSWAPLIALVILFIGLLVLFFGLLPNTKTDKLGTVVSLMFLNAAIIYFVIIIHASDLGGDGSNSDSAKTVVVFEKTYTWADAVDEEGGFYTLEFGKDANMDDTIEVIAQSLDGSKFSGNEIFMWQGENFATNWEKSKQGRFLKKVENLPIGKKLVLSFYKRKDLKVLVKVTREKNNQPELQLLTMN